MKTDKCGCSTCPVGQEQYEPFTHLCQNFIQYEYRAPNGELFATVKKTLEECRKARDKWMTDLVDPYNRL